MGFALPEIKKVVKPRYKNTIVCQRCLTEYKKDTKWVYGNYDGSTTTNFYIMGKISENVCPVCRMPENIDKQKL